MRILMINKFLYPNGGSETYIFKLGEALGRYGHEVQYFGMEHEGRCVGNRVNAYTSDMDFHGGSKLSKLTYPIKTIYSKEARKKLRLVLDDFQPDVCHLNNFNFQLTPSIILEICKYEKQSGNSVKIVLTAHDSQLVCPNHLMQNPGSGRVCTKCLGGHYFNCLKGKCIHGSVAKSLIGMLEAQYWNLRRTYRKIDAIVSPSTFLEDKLNTNPNLSGRIHVLHNFTDVSANCSERQKDNYVLYFGRYSEEKGIGTLLKVVDALPNIPFVFAGNGPLSEEVHKRKNIKDRGFLSGADLQHTIAAAQFTVVPSECYENCPFTVMESQMYGTPVLGARIGGIPEMIQEGRTGELFESGNAGELRKKIEKLWNNREMLYAYTQNCKDVSFDLVEEYITKLMKIYQ